MLLKLTYAIRMTTTNAVVLLSGGQDSATCLAIAQKKHAQLHCVCVDYGQRHRIEIECSKQLAHLANATFECIELPFIPTWSNSALVNSDEPIHHPNGELPTTFVPGRNALFITLAAMVAHRTNCTTIYTGVCETDYSGYPDCRHEFIQSQQTTLRLAMANTMTIETPLMWLSKADTVKQMVTLSKLDWYAHTHTCYEGQRPACGTCPACKLRRQGFDDAGIKDPIPYANQ